VRGLLRYISRHDFTVFAWYRIASGLVVLRLHGRGPLDGKLTRPEACVRR